MIALELGAWLVLGALLFGSGFLAAVLGGLERRLGVAVSAMVGGAVVITMALVRHQVLTGAGLGLALVMILGGALFLMAADGREAP